MPALQRKPIFVFGSNEAGRHGKGAALFALRNHGARYGVGEGMQGNSYAIPTKCSQLVSLSLPRIEHHVARFLRYAKSNPDLTFEVTRVGCGLAGYKDHQIGPMFASAPANCILPDEWRQYQVTEPDLTKPQEPIA